MVHFFVVVTLAVCCLIPVSAAGRYTRFVARYTQLVAGISVWQAYSVDGRYTELELELENFIFQGL